jgi:hypothetical protein
MKGSENKALYLQKIVKKWRGENSKDSMFTEMGRYNKLEKSKFKMKILDSDRSSKSVADAANSRPSRDELNVILINLRSVVYKKDVRMPTLTLHQTKLRNSTQKVKYQKII